ncbi:WXG100 family type VII secretion target [Micromonospora sp. URMC 103]|uniref:WXG100 family type VII secretion target n=1 Tax=Micromonospora sp. URMC 103 TaxID=3423406 RepID=UPI003F1D478B
MGDKSWEDMAREVCVAGRPADVQSAALGWKELVKNLGEVKESLEKNVKDLGAVWKGPAYEAFKTHIEGLAKQTGNLQDDIDKPGRGKVSIVTTLETAARQLEAAQNEMPIPAACIGDVLAARNGEITLGVGLFETRVKADLLGSWPAEQLGKLGDWVTGWFSDKEGEARKVYDEVNGHFRDRTMEAPGRTGGYDQNNVRPDVPNLDTGGGNKGNVGSVPNIGSGMPKTGGIGDTPTMKTGDLPQTGTPPGIGSGAHPDLSNNYPSTGGVGGGGGGGGAYPSTGGLPGDYGTGLAGAGGGTGTMSGLGSGSGLSTSGLGGGGLGGGAGAIPGGGALGKAVSPGMPPMMGGGMAGAGGGGRGAGGRMGAGRPGMGMPGMAGGAGAGGRGAGAKGGGVGARGAGARGGMAGMGGGHGAGYGEEESARNTWLEEDEDVWGVDDGGTPGILR